MKTCSGKTKAGKSCRAAAGPGGLCFFHANPDRAKSLGKLGGLKNKKFTGVNLEVPDSLTAADLCRLEVQVVKGLLSGEIPAREATAVGQMFNLLHRHLPTAELEKRVALLEEHYKSESMSTDMTQTDMAENKLHDFTDVPAGASERNSREASNRSNADEDGDENL